MMTTRPALVAQWARVHCSPVELLFRGVVEARRLTLRQKVSGIREFSVQFSALSPPQEWINLPPVVGY